MFLSLKIDIIFLNLFFMGEKSKIYLKKLKFKILCQIQVLMSPSKSTTKVDHETCVTRLHMVSLLVTFCGMSI